MSSAETLTVTGSDEPELSIFDICETDTTAEEEGRWFKNIYGNDSKIDVKLRRLTSRKSIEARRRLEKGYRKYLKNGEMSDEIADQILIEQLADAILVDWRNIKVPENVDGKKVLVELPYSKEAAKMLLTKLPNFRIAILGMSQDIDNFRHEEVDLTSKN